MTAECDRKFSVYKGLQRPIQFKGLKGNYIYYAFGIALSSLFAGIFVTMLFNFTVGSICIVAVAIGGIVGLAVYQRKFGLYKKNQTKGIYIVYTLFNRNK